MIIFIIKVHTKLSKWLVETEKKKFAITSINIFISRHMIDVS